jgi:hypothetical protein
MNRLIGHQYGIADSYLDAIIKCGECHLRNEEWWQDERGQWHAPDEKERPGDEWNGN